MRRELPPAGVSDPPFKLPPDRASIVTIVDLPYPPSTNAIWKWNKNGVSTSKDYKVWKESADKFVMYTGAHKRATKITGHFTVDIVLDENERKRANAAGRKMDADNFIKSVMDWCQSRELIRDDSDCDGGTWRWGLAPHGCRVTLTEVV